MEMELGTRPIGHHSHDWRNRLLPNGTLEPPPSPGPSSSAPSAFASTSAGLSPQRRSSVAHTRPAGPPPNLPIPNIPVSSLPASPPRGSVASQLEDSHISSTYVNGRGTRSSSFMRPRGSPGLAAVASYPQSREMTMSASHNLPSSTGSSIEDLSDPPPQSFLHSSSSRAADHHHEHVPDRSSLSPPEAEVRTEPRVPSSRRALTRALELAREAVQLDTMNDNPEAAVQAYGRSVALLSEVMERVRRGEDSTESHRRRRRRSVAAQEEEVRRLQNIHDTYADRMNILSIIYSIPPAPYSSSLAYSAMADSAASPTTSVSPSSESSPRISQSPYIADSTQNEPQRHPVGEYAGHDPALDGPEAAGPMMFTPDDTVSAISGLPSTSNSQHPYAVQYDPPQSTAPPIAPPSAQVPGNRSSTITRRSRALSNLPPPPPPPSNSLPPAPMPVVVEPSPTPPSQQRHLDMRTRQRGESIAHKRTSSNGLEALEEEYDDGPIEGLREGISDISSRMNSTHLIPDTPRNSNRDSHPLPPLPSPSAGSPGTPRNPLSASKPPTPPRPSAPRPRGSSQLTTRSEFVNHPHIINTTTTQGTISQRRAKASAPPGSRSSSPAGSTASTGSVPQPRSTASSLPSTGPTGVIQGRSRSSSQPGRRPSLVGGRISPLDQRPPLPSTIGVNGTSIRKTSVPSKLNPNPQPIQLSVHTDLPYGNGAFSLVPPAFPNLPTTPISPLPPTPPNDPLLKPYHLMNLLRITMTSTTGGYVTRRLHVPLEVWSQGGAKLSNVSEKVRVVAILCSALEELQSTSLEYFGAGNVSSGLALGIGSIDRKAADAWFAKLEDFSSVCDTVVTDFGKKLGVGEGFVLKKTTWGDKLTRRFDKLTNGKNLDSPAAYVRGLEKLFLHVQLLDEHTRAALSHPVAPAYAAFPIELRASTEQKLKRASEFFASVVLTFVIRDLSQLLDKYAKKCEKWLAE